jgi:hypothetical protein
MSLDDRLRQALAARADLSEPRPDAWEKLQDRRERDRHTRRSRVLSAAAALTLLALVVGGLALARSEGGEQVATGPDEATEGTQDGPDDAVVLATVDGDIVRTRLDRPEERVVLATLPERTLVVDLTVDRSGTDIYVVTLEERGCTPVINRLEGHELIPITEGFQVAVAGSTMAYVPIEEGSCARWQPAPDGRPLSWVLPGVSGEVVVRDLDNSDERTLPPGAEGDSAATSPTLSTDGTRLAYDLASPLGECAWMPCDPPPDDDRVVVVWDLTADTSNRLDSAEFTSLSSPVFRDDDVLAVGAGPVTQGSELAAYDLEPVPPFGPYPRTPLALPTWRDPARRPEAIDVLGDRLLWLDTDPSTGRPQLWWQGLTDGSPAVLVESDAVAAAFASPAARANTDSTATTIEMPDSPSVPSTAR